MKSIEQSRSSMETFLQKFSGSSVLYLPNPGNAGDALIAHGTYEAFRRRAIDYTIIDLNANVEGKVVFLSGGGNLVPLYHSVEAALNRFLKRAAHIVLLPHTIRGHEVLISRLDESCTIFCRDAPSYEHVTSLNQRSHVALEHDMAFHIDAQSFIEDDVHAALFMPIVKQKLAERGLKNIADRPAVDFFRLDLESTKSNPVTTMDPSIDFSLGPKGGWPDEARKATWCMLKAVSMARKVRTDRLHVGISCALMSTACELYDNSYGKNASVYRHSLRNRTPFIEFKKEDEVSFLAEA